MIINDKGGNVDSKLAGMQGVINSYLSNILTDMEAMGIDTNHVSIDINILIKESDVTDIGEITISI